MSHVLLAFLFLVTSPADQDGWKEAKAEAKKAVRSPVPRVRREAVEALSAFDRKEAAELLLDIWSTTAKRARAMKVEKVEKIEKMDSMPIKKKLQAGMVTLNGGEVQEKAEYDRIKAEVKDLTTRISQEEAIKDLIRSALTGMKEAGAVKILEKRLTSSKEWEVRAAAAGALGAFGEGEVFKTLEKALKREKDPRAIVAIFEAFGEMRAKEALPAMEKKLKKNKAWQVVLAAAEAIRQIDDPKGVEILISLLKDADGRIKEDLNDVLVEMTGVDKRGSHATWLDWWNTNKERLIAGTYDKPSRPKGGEKAGGTTFYGIPVVSSRVVFILDRSGSMSSPAGWKPDTGVATGKDGGGRKPEKVGDRKIDVAKYELKNAIRALKPHVRFNVIFYNQDYMIWLENGLAIANAKSKKEAIAFIDKLEPEGATNIFDPTEKGFLIQEKKDPRAKKDPDIGLIRGGVDTIYLLSDGHPNNGRITEPGAILAKVKEINRVRKIVIHSIGVGPSIDVNFMRSLAEDNGGTFVHRK